MRVAACICFSMFSITIAAKAQQSRAADYMQNEMDCGGDEPEAFMQCHPPAPYHSPAPFLPTTNLPSFIIKTPDRLAEHQYHKRLDGQL